MKKIIIGMLSFLSITAYAQNQRFSYEYKFVIDSTEKDKVETEIMLLNVFSKGSQFYSQAVAKTDSTMSAEISKQVNSGSTNINLKGIALGGRVRHQVEKNYPDYLVNYFIKMGGEEYMVTESRNQDWKILPDKEKIGELMAQKATCNFAGRSWIAWFVAEIPIQDGPYKFHGLPGLIVKIEDQTKSHSYELKGIKKLSEDTEFKSFKDKTRYNSLIALDQKKFKKAYLDFRADPNKGARQMASSGTVISMKDASGNPVDMNKMMKDREKKQIEVNKKNNNLLELDLLK